MANNKSNSNFGCAKAYVFILLIGVAIWLLTAAMWIVGVLIALAAVVGAVLLIAYAWKGVKLQKESESTSAEVELLAQDCARDLRELQFRWTEAVMTKGIGTSLETRFKVQPDLAENQRREIESMILLVEQAPATQQRLEAVSQAEGLRVRVEKQLAP